jgi:hypothetical protein
MYISPVYNKYNSITTNTTMSNLAVINYNDWNPTELIYSSPTKNDRGLTTVKVISKKTKRALSISTPVDDVGPRFRG